jgi:hypothetical protein
MTTRAALHAGTASSIEKSAFSLRRVLLGCGIVGAVLYPLSDIFAATRYQGFSYRDQAVSELFAIGAPTSGLVVPLFTASSTLLLLFAVGIWMSGSRRRWVRPMAVMMAFNTIDALVLWNFFPMHMRGTQPTFTDTMHGVLAIDPFLIGAIVLGAMAFPGRFRAYTIATIAFTSILAIGGFTYVPAVIANEPTPWMGVVERTAQYATNVWYAALAALLLRTQATSPEPRRPQAVWLSNSDSAPPVR